MIMTLAQAIKIRLNELMKEHNLNGYRLSMKSGVSQTTISDIKYCRNAGINLRIIYELTQGLEISIAEFFDSPLFRDNNIVD